MSTPVFPLADLAPGTAMRVDVAGRSVAVVRIGDDVYAIGDTCSHAEVSLSEGDVWCDEKELECWKHGSTFSLVLPRRTRPGKPSSRAGEGRS